MNAGEQITCMPETAKIRPITFQDIGLVVSYYRNTPNKDQFMQAMKSGGIEVNGQNITPIDFFSSNPDLSDSEINEAIRGYLGLGMETMASAIEIINESIESARNYLQNYLHISPLPREIINLQPIKNENDIIKIFRKTAALKKGSRMGLSPYYCAFLSVVAAMFEFRKEALDGLIKESSYLYSEMQKSEGEINYFHEIQTEEKNYDKLSIYAGGKTAIYTESYFRGKNECSFVSKLLTKPEATAEEAAKDGIGLKFEVKTKNDVVELVKFLTNYFTNQLHATDLIFENTRLIESNELILLKNGLTQLFNNTEQSIKNDDNPHSNEGFKAFKINGKIQVPKDGTPGNMSMERGLEIQIVLTNNENESKFSNHYVYEASKKLAIITRLFGSISEKHLQAIAGEASVKSNLSEHSITEYLKNNFLKELATQTTSKKKRYVHKKTFLRLRDAQIIPTGTGINE